MNRIIIGPRNTARFLLFVQAQVRREPRRERRLLRLARGVDGLLLPVDRLAPLPISETPSPSSRRSSVFWVLAARSRSSAALPSRDRRARPRQPRQRRRTRLIGVGAPTSPGGRASRRSASTAPAPWRSRSSPATPAVWRAARRVVRRQLLHPRCAGHRRGLRFAGRQVGAHRGANASSAAASSPAVFLQHAMAVHGRSGGTAPRLILLERAMVSPVM